MLPVRLAAWHCERSTGVLVVGAADVAGAAGAGADAVTVSVTGAAVLVADDVFDPESEHPATSDTAPTTASVATDVAPTLMARSCHRKNSACAI
ncbi:hypothetical protein GCM10027169_00030 [Gordonia jinhuaensis]|uniref:Uncharacterized protein n=1 Tax=Gordonia jinhuaensis TaxID=1517702 RepID=A0A916SUU1_9ACTN|nr:hypothetical protein GCM10011489_02690 [Gordonia jinhuaensis]